MLCLIARERCSPSDMVNGMTLLKWISDEVDDFNGLMGIILLGKG